MLQLDALTTGAVVGCRVAGGPCRALPVRLVGTELVWEGAEPLPVATLAHLAAGAAPAAGWDSRLALTAQAAGTAGRRPVELYFSDEATYTAWFRGLHGLLGAGAPSSREELVCVKAYRAQDDRQLTLAKGDRVQVLERSSHGWVGGQLADGRLGWVPATVLEPAPPRRLSAGAPLPRAPSPRRLTDNGGADLRTTSPAPTARRASEGAQTPTFGPPKRVVTPKGAQSSGRDLRAELAAHVEAERAPTPTGSGRGLTEELVAHVEAAPPRTCDAASQSDGPEPGTSRFPKRVPAVENAATQAEPQAALSLPGVETRTTIAKEARPEAERRTTIAKVDRLAEEAVRRAEARVEPDAEQASAKAEPKATHTAEAEASPEFAALAQGAAELRRALQAEREEKAALREQVQRAEERALHYQKQAAASGRSAAAADAAERHAAQEEALRRRAEAAEAELRAHEAAATAARRRLQAHLERTAGPDACRRALTAMDAEEADGTPVASFAKLRGLAEARSNQHLEQQRAWTLQPPPSKAPDDCAGELGASTRSLALQPPPQTPAEESAGELGPSACSSDTSFVFSIRNSPRKMEPAGELGALARVDDVAAELGLPETPLRTPAHKVGQPPASVSKLRALFEK